MDNPLKAEEKTLTYAEIARLAVAVASEQDLETHGTYAEIARLAVAAAEAQNKE